MTRDEQIQYVAENSNHSFAFIKLLVERNEDSLALMLGIADKVAIHELEDANATMS